MLERIALAWLVPAVVLGASTSFAAQDQGAEASVQGGFVGEPVPSDLLALDAFAFDPYNPLTRDAIRSLSGSRYCDSPEYCTLGAPIELASGAIVHRLLLDAVDWGDGTVQAVFYRCPLADGACYPSGAVSTTGSPGPVRVIDDLSVPRLIDNQTHSYFLRVTIEPGTQQASDARLIGVKVVYHRSGTVGPTEQLAVHPLAFEAYGPGRDDVEGYYRYCPGTTCTLEAPVELPTGSVVSRVQLEAFDGDPGANAYVSMYLKHCRRATMQCESLGFGYTDGSPGLVQVALPGTDLIIDNVRYTYALQAFVLGGTASTKLNGARLFFHPPSSSETWDTLAIHPFAFEIESPEDAAIGRNGTGRYCDGVDCTLKAPIELPTGTVIWRINLDAFDRGSGKVNASLMRCDSASGLCYTNGSVETSGTPGLTEVGRDLPVPEIVDNDRFSYVARVLLTGGTDESRINGLRFIFTPVWILNDGFEAGTVLSWSGWEPHCSEHGDCEEVDFCMKNGCDDLIGACETKPLMCLHYWDPVCGCDGQTYSNTCYAAQAGVNIASQGECPP